MFLGGFADAGGIDEVEGEGGSEVVGEVRVGADGGGKFEGVGLALLGTTAVGIGGCGL
jgi:hypothetical protein